MTNDTNQPKNAEDMTLRTDFLGDQDDTAPWQIAKICH